MAKLTIEQWLIGMVDFSLPDATLMAVLYNNGISDGAYMADVTERQRDLALADIYMWLATSSSTSSGEYEADGGWQHSRGVKNVIDRSGFRARAMELYRKWGSEKANSSIGGIVMKDLY